MQKIINHRFVVVQLCNSCDISPLISVFVLFFKEHSCERGK